MSCVAHCPKTGHSYSGFYYCFWAILGLIESHNKRSRLRGTEPVTRTIKWIVLTSFLCALFGTKVQAQGTFTAASCNLSDVNAVVNGPTHVAIAGDTIIIPSGTCTWGSNSASDSPLSITVDITLQGQGQGVTFIIDNMDKGNSNCQFSNSLIQISESGNSLLRVTGFTIS